MTASFLQQNLPDKFTLILQDLQQPCFRKAHSLCGAPEAGGLNEVGCFCPGFRPQVANIQLELNPGGHLQHTQLAWPSKAAC